jgi:hypothetical protein
MPSCCIFVHKLSISFCLAQIRLWMSEIWPQKGHWKVLVGGMIRGNFEIKGQIMSGKPELIGSYKYTWM